MGIKDYRDLVVWQRAMDLTEMVYGMSRSFPKEEIFGLTAQLRRAAVSVPANIAEGQGRHTTRDFIQFLSIASGSLKELETHVLIAQRLGYIIDDAASQAIALAAEVGRLKSGLVRSLREKIPSGNSIPRSSQRRSTTDRQAPPADH
jgi:four helix bundle protein